MTQIRTQRTETMKTRFDGTWDGVCIRRKIIIREVDYSSKQRTRSLF